jgi:hypothetical protein
MDPHVQQGEPGQGGQPNAPPLHSFSALVRSPPGQGTEGAAPPLGRCFHWSHTPQLKPLLIEAFQRRFKCFCQQAAFGVR